MAEPNYLYVAITESQPYDLPGRKPAPNGAVISTGKLPADANGAFAVLSFFNPTNLYHVIGVNTSLTPYELAAAIAKKYSGPAPLQVNGQVVTLFNFDPDKKTSLLEDLVRNAQDYNI